MILIIFPMVNAKRDRLFAVGLNAGGEPISRFMGEDLRDNQS
jgi:hypothetical protein